MQTNRFQSNTPPRNPSGSNQPSKPTGESNDTSYIIAKIKALKLAATTPADMQRFRITSPSCCMRAPNSNNLRALKPTEGKFRTPKAAQEALFSAVKSAKKLAVKDALHCPWTDINRKDTYGQMSAIEYAAKNGNANAVFALRRHGAVVPLELINELKTTGVDREEIVQLLLWDVGPVDENSQWPAVDAKDLAQVDTRGNSQLHIMVRDREFKELIALCKNSGRQGADLKEMVNVKNAKGDTPLHWAAQFANDDPAYVHLIRQLCRMGADPTIRNYSGETPIHLTGKLPILEIFTEHYGEDATKLVNNIKTMPSEYEYAEEKKKLAAERQILERKKEVRIQQERIRQAEIKEAENKKKRAQEVKNSAYIDPYAWDYRKWGQMYPG